MPRTRTKNSTQRAANQLRIIGGQWRGRKLHFPSIEGLRPTPDRVRETLFNWLAPVLPGARCLDLFAGSGALGLEALSRGAASADLIDNASAAVNQLRQNLQLLNTDRGQVINASAEQWLPAFNPQHDNRYDIIFLDPPFHKAMAGPCINGIEQQQLLNDNSWVYLEMAKDDALPKLPDRWYLHREKVAGQVCYRLFSVRNH
jgi:16S rRNA (guanine966-N2)-methyltransferase